MEIHRIRNEVDQAVKLIQAFVDRPNLAPQALGTLADLAEKMKQIALAEQLYRRLAECWRAHSEASYSWLHFLAATIK